MAVKGRAWLVLVATSLGLGTPLTGQTQGARTTLDGVYTSEQAALGRQTYQRVCSECHSLDYYSGATIRPWAGADVYSMYNLIRTQMPQNNPGSLRPREYVAMIAYILELNGMPAGGEALSSRRSELQSIVFKWTDEG